MANIVLELNFFCVNVGNLMMKNKFQQIQVKADIKG